MGHGLTTPYFIFLLLRPSAATKSPFIGIMAVPEGFQAFFDGMKSNSYHLSSGDMQE